MGLDITQFQQAILASKHLWFRRDECVFEAELGNNDICCVNCCGPINYIEYGSWQCELTPSQGRALCDTIRQHIERRQVANDQRKLDEVIKLLQQ